MAILWSSKLLIGVVTAVCLAAGIIAYFLIPPSFTSKAVILPLRQTQFSGYLGLAQEGGISDFKDNESTKVLEERAFPYTPSTLFTEFTTYVTDPDRIAEIADKGDIVAHENLSEDAYRQRIMNFVSSIRFTTPKPQEIQAGIQYLNIEAKSDNKEKLTAFMQQLLLGANRDMATDLAADVRTRADEIKEKLASQIAKLQIDIDARRHTQENMRADNIARLAEQSIIARSLGIQKPINLQAIEKAEQGKTAAQINTSGEQNQPDYLQGYIALDESISTLKNRKDSDPFITDLRTIEQQLYILKNDPRPARIQALLERSPLRDPSTAAVARFSTTAVVAEKTFPRLSIFGAGALLLGLALGTSVAFMRKREMSSRLEDLQAGKKNQKHG